MRASYSLALTRLYQSINAWLTTADIRTLYRVIYPQIYMAARKGETRCVCKQMMTSAMVDQLVREGYLVMIDGTHTMIDWADPMADLSIRHRSPINEIIQRAIDEAAALPVVPNRQDLDAAVINPS